MVAGVYSHRESLNSPPAVWRVALTASICSFRSPVCQATKFRYSLESPEPLAPVGFRSARSPPCPPKTLDLGWGSKVVPTELPAETAFQAKSTDPSRANAKPLGDFHGVEVLRASHATIVPQTR